MFVYAFINKVTKECMYVGSTVHIGDRMKVHRFDSKTDEKVLYQKIREISWDFVEIKMISENSKWSIDELRIEEQKHIEELKPLYNMYMAMRTEEEDAMKRSECKRKCYEAKKEEYLATSKAYRDANKESIAAKSKEWREANKEGLLAAKKAYREANKDDIAAKAKAFREANPEAYAEKQRLSYIKRKEKKAKVASDMPPL